MVHSFLLLIIIPLCMYTYTPLHLFIYSPVIDFNVFQYLGITNKAAMSICVQVTIWTYAFSSLGKISKRRMA